MRRPSVVTTDEVPVAEVVERMSVLCARRVCHALSRVARSFSVVVTRELDGVRAAGDTGACTRVVSEIW